MTAPRHIAVIDIGKSNVKLALVDLDRLTEVEVVTCPNIVQPGPPWGHFDTQAHWAFLCDALGASHRTYGIDAISVTTHGASIVLLDKDGRLAAPILDYEHPIPDTTARDYDRIRPPFAQTGAPRLAGGLNVGAQLHYQFTTDKTLHARTKAIVGYPQYWGHRLTGKIACDVTSIGCHTDLWQPQAHQFSDLVETLDIADKIAPIRKPTDILGTIAPAVSDATGLPQGVPVAVGIHDSNASLYPHLRARTGPFSVVSTGTWVVVMAVGGHLDRLDPDRDTLVNVDARGAPVPSARFMGGREYALLQADRARTATPDDIAAVLATSLMILPAVEPATGPFQGRAMRWTGPEPAATSGLRAAAASFYLAMMTSTCLALTGADGPTIVEGPFAQNTAFLDMLAVATGRPVLHGDTATGTSIGAALLFADSVSAQPYAAANTAPSAPWRDYAARWRELVDANPSI